MGKTLKQRNSRYGYLMSTPATLIFVALSIYPLLYTFLYSFTDYYFLSKTGYQIVGLKNYGTVLKDAYFRQVTWNTLRYTFGAVVIETVVGLLVAILINSIKHCQKALRTIILLPTLLPPITVALLWKMMYSNNHGVINYLFTSVGLKSQNWLLDPKTALLSILIVDVWQFIPFSFLLIYASLQSVPQDQYEAARIDGANAIQSFFKITLPNISNGIMMVILLRTIDSFRLFDKVNILTKGGPANTSASITQYIYQYGITNLKIGYGSTASVVMTIIVLILSAYYVKKVYSDK